MRCHVCNVAVGDGQRFCHECGESLEEVTAQIRTVDASSPSEPEPADATVLDESVDSDESSAASIASLVSDVEADPDDADDQVDPEGQL
ncbi:MAG: hypothetical protein WBV89_00960, partial [Ilumatobacter sp.]